MAGDRTLSLKLLADTKNLVDGLNKGSKATESFGDQIADISGKVVKSFLAIGTAVTAFGAAFAKAAAEDQQAANRLSQTLDSVTNATNKQIAAVGTYITQTSLATGITDDELRPAFERLARSTGDVEKSQTLLNLALDLSAATGKPLEAVTNSLAKAYDGSYTSLQRLGLGIDANLIKSKDFDAIQKQLNSTFGEFSEKRSEEALVKFQKLQRAIEEAKEAVGAALLPVFERLGDWLLNEGVPRLNAFVAGLIGDNSLSYAYGIAEKQSEEFGQKVRSIFDKFVEYKDILKDVAIAVTAVFVVSKIAAAAQATIVVIQGLIAAYNALKASAIVAGVATAFALNPLLGVGAVALGASILAGAAAMSRNSDVNFEDIAGGGVGLGNRPLGGMVSGLGAGGGAGGGGGVTSFGAGGGGGQSLAELSKGLVTSPQDLLNKLQSTSGRISDIQFALDTGQISKAKAAALLKPIESEFNMLQRVAESLQTSSTPYNTRSAEEIRFAQAVAGSQIVINVNAPSVIDENGFSRAVQNAIQNAEARGTYAGGL